MASSVFMQTEDAVERFNNMPVGGLFHSTC
jgi:hypothetical protein